MILALAVVAGVWWWGTRDIDFLAPPTEEELAAARGRVDLLPQTEFPADAVSPPPKPPPPPPPPPPPVVKPKPVIGLGDLTQAPKLDEYAAAAAMGSDALIELAGRLEKKQETQRALLAWERVLDSGHSDPGQVGAAILAVRRLRATVPPWNKNLKDTLAIRLRASSNRKNSQALKAAINKAAREIETASSGILKVTAEVTPGRQSTSGSGASTVALWLVGTTAKPISTETRLFTVPASGSLADEVSSTVFHLIRGYLGDHPTRKPPPTVALGAAPAEGLQYHLTRLHWHDLGTALNRPPAKKSK